MSLAVGIALGAVIYVGVAVLARQWPAAWLCMRVTLAAIMAPTAVYNIVTGDTAQGIWDAVLAGLNAYWAWMEWRKRKRRKPSRVLGVVRNLGHRLAVVPVPGGAR